MASNFHMFSFKTRDCLHLKLEGDFDGNSAYELLETLKKYNNGSYQIFIDTNDLKTIYPSIHSANKCFRRNLVFTNSK